MTKKLNNIDIGENLLNSLLFISKLQLVII